MNKKEFLEKYTGSLNEQQLTAVQAVNGPVLLLAVPGSGKTTVLVNRLGYMTLCEGINPENILTLTYTVAATADMEQRFISVFGEENAARLEFRTINGICSKIIRRYAQMIGKSEFALLSDEKEKIRILTEILVKKLPDYPTESDVKNASTLITYCKNMLLENNEVKELGEEEDLPLLDIFTQYNKYLRDNRLMDYDDQMVYAYRMLRGSEELLSYYRNQYRYICVDEAQDTSKVQHIIIGLLAGQNGNLFMVGDEDQSIYSFRAAYPEALLNFEKDHPKAKVLVMDKNYRSNAKIVSMADRLIQHNRSRHAKHIVATRAAGADIEIIDMKRRMSQYDFLLEVATNCTRETAVLYRDNESILPLVDLLERQNIPFRMKSSDIAFFTHRVVNDVTDIMHFAMNPYDTELFMRIYYKCQTYLKKEQAVRVCNISREREIQVLEAVKYLPDVSDSVAEKCKLLAEHMRSMLLESPEQVLTRIQNALGYGEYLERKKINANKLFILKKLAANERTMFSYLSRLEYLRDMLKDYSADKKCRFILSTVHSSKGLEYEQVYMMDVCDGVFPTNVIRTMDLAEPKEIEELEEERRLFYVGITRAKDELHILRYADYSSCFISEIGVPDRRECGKSDSGKNDSGKYDSGKCNSGKYDSGKCNSGKYGRGLGSAYEQNGEYTTDYVLKEGERVIQASYGIGTVSEIERDADGEIKKFMVSFDSGTEKKYLYPVAFKNSMQLMSGETIKLFKK